MTWFGNFYSSSLGKKAVMAITGIVFWGFVVAHMAGNLKVFTGAESFNHYAEWLRAVGTPAFPDSGVLWLLRVVLLASLVLHVHATYALTLMNRRARPSRYQDRDVVQADLAARTMRWSGVLILLFVIYHLMHFTWGTVHQDFIAGDVYHNAVSAFRIWWVTAIYLVSMVALGFHLYHGLWSLFQSLGWSHPRYNRWRRAFAVLFAILVPAGFAVVPVLVFAGVVR